MSAPEPTAGQRCPECGAKRAAHAVVSVCPATPDADDASTEASEGLTEAEREQVALACDAMFDFGDTWIRFLREGNETVLLPVVERIVAAREAKARADERERIAQAIEALPEYDGAGWPHHAYEIKEDAARIARGDAT